MRHTSKSLLPYYQEIDLASRESERRYEFPGGEVVVIAAPKTLIVSDNGHRIVTCDGRSHYIPYGWIHLWWENLPGRPNNAGFYCQEKTEAAKE